MGSIHNLIELLKSQLALYSEVRDILIEEKAAIIAWNLSGTNHLIKRKDKIVYKERILEDARRCLAERIKEELNAKGDTLTSIIEVCPSDVDRKELSTIRENLIELVQLINNENISLKMLYATNIGIVNEFNNQLGIIMPVNGYDKHRKPESTSTSIHAIG